MAEPFQRAEHRATQLGRIFRGRRAAAWDAIECLLADAAQLRDVAGDELQKVCAEHRIDLQRTSLRERRRIYRRYLEHCLEDRVLSEEENADLAHLKAILHLAPDEVDRIHETVARNVYGKAVEEVLADSRLDPDEEAFLRRLRGELRLPEQEAEHMLARGAEEARDRALSSAIAQDEHFAKHRVAAGEFTGRATTSFEDSVGDALAKATVAIPSLHWFEITHIRGYVEDGRPSGWHVTLRAGIRQDD
jgi:flavin-binding protein dodecin